MAKSAHKRSLSSDVLRQLTSPLCCPCIGPKTSIEQDTRLLAACRVEAKSVRPQPENNCATISPLEESFPWPSPPARNNARCPGVVCEWSIPYMGAKKLGPEVLHVHSKAVITNTAGTTMSQLLWVSSYQRQVEKSMSCLCRSSKF